MYLFIYLFIFTLANTPDDNNFLTTNKGNVSKTSKSARSRSKKDDDDIFGDSDELPGKCGFTA